MSDHMKKVQSGDPLKISAGTFNSFVDAARDFQQRQRAQVQTPQPTFRDHGVVLVRNDSGADRDRFDVLGIDVPIILPEENEPEFANRVALSGVAPALPDHAGRFLVLMEPLADGEIGRGLLSGITPVRLTVNAESDAFADIADAEATCLQSMPTGAAQILWKEDSTATTVWAVVRLGLPARQGFWARITASTAVGYGYPDESNDSWRWEYDFEEVAKTATGYGGWVARSGGIVSDSTVKAYNTIEDRDASADGLHGNGVVLDNLHPEDETFEFQVQPAPDGAIVWMRAVPVTPTEGEPSVEYWFTYENGLDGGCGVEEAV